MVILFPYSYSSMSKTGRKFSGTEKHISGQRKINDPTLALGGFAPKAQLNNPEKQNSSHTQQ
jgi:hypothetical protein